MGYFIYSLSATYPYFPWALPEPISPGGGKNAPPPYVSQKKKYSLDPIELKFSKDDMSNHMRVTNQEKSSEKKFRQNTPILRNIS